MSPFMMSTRLGSRCSRFALTIRGYGARVGEMEPINMTDPVGEPRPVEAKDSKSLLNSLSFIGAAVGVFIVCSLVQGAFGSSMFTSTYSDPGLIGSLLIKLTFMPGWALTILLAGMGLLSAWATLSKR